LNRYIKWIFSKEFIFKRKISYKSWSFQWGL